MTVRLCRINHRTASIGRGVVGPMTQEAGS